MTNELRSPVEDVATAIAEQVRENGWYVDRLSTITTTIRLHDERGFHFMSLHCADAWQAKRLAEMMRAPPSPVFDAMNLPELPAFPSIRGKA